MPSASVESKSTCTPFKLTVHLYRAPLVVGFIDPIVKLLLLPVVSVFPMNTFGVAEYVASCANSKVVILSRGPTVNDGLWFQT